MTLTRFGNVLKEFESYFGCTLAPDEKNCCTIKLPSGFLVQIEPDAYETSVTVGIRLGDISQRPYFSDLLEEGLKANFQDEPRQSGVLGYSKKSGQLILFMNFPLENITINLLKEIMPFFLEKAARWRDAVNSGNLLQLQQP